MIAQGTVKCTVKSSVLFNGDELSVSANAFVLRRIYMILVSRRCAVKQRKFSDMSRTVNVSKIELTNCD